MRGPNLLGPTDPIVLPADPGDAELAKGIAAVVVAAAHPTCLAAWAALAEHELAADADTTSRVRAYAYARVGYHRGLDALRASGWRGSGPVPWSAPSNRGFLRALAALGHAAKVLGETDEAQRCAQFLVDCDPGLSHGSVPRD